MAESRGRSHGTGGGPGSRRAGWRGDASGSHRVGTPMVPALAVVCGHAGACLAAEVPVPAHAAWGLPLAAVTLSIHGTGLPAGLLAGLLLPSGHLLPHFPRGVLCQGRPSPPPGSAQGPPWFSPSHARSPSYLSSLPRTAHSVPAASRLPGLQTHCSTLIHPPTYQQGPAWVLSLQEATLASPVHPNLIPAPVSHPAACLSVNVSCLYLLW